MAPTPRPAVPHGERLGSFSSLWEEAARAAVARTVRRGSLAYRREATLMRVLPRATLDLPEAEPRRTALILLRIARALRAERRLGRAGHWTYDIARHVALAQAFAAERRTLERLLRPVRRG
ncbi:DUF6477 family protein [Alsobacter sp. R-9]